MDGWGVGEVDLSPEFGREEYGGRSIDASPGVSFESGRRLCFSGSAPLPCPSSSSPFCLAPSACRLALPREIGLLVPLERVKDLNDAALEDAVIDGVGVVPLRVVVVMGNVLLRTLTRIEECILMESLLLSTSFGRRSVFGLGGFP